jgi:hypothetical protein
MSGTDKLTIATELLTQSSRPFFEGAYFASLHLAGAAEELFGVYIANAGGVSSFKNMTRSVAVLSKLLNEEASEKDISRLMNHAKNRTKHMYQSNDDVVHFDARA